MFPWKEPCEYDVIWKWKWKSTDYIFISKKRSNGHAEYRLFAEEQDNVYGYYGKNQCGTSNVYAVH